MKALGSRVRERRAMLGWSQTKLGSKVDRSHAWVSDLERGRAGEVPSDTITALAVQLGEDPREYLRLAGRVLLTAEDLVPTLDSTPPWAREIMARLDRLTTGSAVAEQKPLGYLTDDRAPDVGEDQAARRRYWLRFARNALKMTRAEAAKTLGYPSSQEGVIGDFEEGRAAPSEAQLAALARVYRVDVALFTDPPETDDERLERVRVRSVDVAETPAGRRAEDRRRQPRRKTA